VLSASTWTDCLVMLQQGQVDAISTDDAVLRGLEAQDPTVEVVGSSLGVEPYGVGVGKDDTDLVRFVNGVLDQMRADGTWQRLYDARLQSLGPSPGPPAARYED
jgi:polar amino acid transport system substrate-binding protein